MIGGGGRRQWPSLRVVTPEHVELVLTPAGHGSRFLALVIDVLVIAAIATFVYRIVSYVLPTGVSRAIYVTVSFFLTFAYHLYYETRGGGRTPGKRALRLRVVDARGLPVTLQQSMVRNVFRALDFAPALYAIGATAALLDKYHRRLGDIVADTLVVQEETPLALPSALAQVRHFNSLRTPRTLHLIRHRISLEEREFLLALCTRADDLEPAVRYDLMESAADFYREKLAIDDPHLSGENLIRDLTSIVFSERA